MKFITWDIVLCAALGLLLAYSLLIQKHKALATLVSAYIAYVMTTLWGESVYQFFSGQRVLLNQVWIKANTTPFTVDVALLIILTVLLSFFIKLSGNKRVHYSVPEISVYSVLTVALVAVFILLFMPVDLRTQVLAGSKILPLLYSARQWVLALPVFAMVFFGMFGGGE